MKRKVGIIASLAALGLMAYMGNRLLAGVRGLYLCGAGAHPGGGITGAPGRNAARAIVADLRRSQRRRRSRSR